jgi:hypothetical protein
MRTWLRLTCLFGPPDDKAECGNIVCASIGLILRADADDLVHGPVPEQLANLLRKIAKAERELAAESHGGVTVCDTAGLIVNPPMPSPQRSSELPVQSELTALVRPTAL